MAGRHQQLDTVGHPTNIPQFPHDTRQTIMAEPYAKGIGHLRARLLMMMKMMMLMMTRSVSQLIAINISTPMQ